MSSSFGFFLVSHIILGLLGTSFYYALWLGLLRTQVNLPVLRRLALSAWLAILLSWITGGYYYAFYYGKAVRSVIRAGAYPWAHAVFMEAKEHIFLFLPFLGALVYLALSELSKDPQFFDDTKRALTFLVGTTTVLAIVITLFGIVISGAVR